MNDIDTNISHDIGIRLTLFADYTSILVTGKDIQDLTLNLDKINKSILPWFNIFVFSRLFKDELTGNT
jgi:hypothetical protein